MGLVYLFLFLSFVVADYLNWYNDAVRETKNYSENSYPVAPLATTNLP
jgi:hypothetical protein